MRTFLVAALVGFWATPATAGYLMIDGKRVSVPFHVVHSFFDFGDAQERALAEAKKVKRAKPDNSEYKHTFAGGIHWLGRVRTERPYVSARAGHPINSVDMVTLHSTMTYDVRAVIRALLERSLSTHLLVDWDGTIYQVADLGLRARHAGLVNDRSIRVDLINPMITRQKLKTKYIANRELLLRKHKLSRPFRKATIQGRTIEAMGYTKPQLESTYALVNALVRLFPNVPARIPRGPDKKVLMGVVKDLSKLKGVVGHWHTSELRWDPGPGIDWEALEKALR